MKRVSLIFCLSAFATPVLAHGGHAEGYGLVAGAMHPLLGADHVAAMLAVGAWASMAGGRARLLWPAAFLAAMIGGFGAALARPEIPGIEHFIAFSVVILVGAALMRARPSTFAGAAVCGFFAIWHGAAHAVEMPVGASAVAYLSGFTFSSAALLTFGLALQRRIGTFTYRSCLAINSRGGAKVRSRVRPVI